jgi:hypothetical protein
VHAATVPVALAESSFTALSYDAQNGLYVGDSMGTVSLWDTRDNACVESWPLEGGEVCALAVVDGKMATAGVSKSIKLWTLYGARF